MKKFYLVVVTVVVAICIVVMHVVYDNDGNSSYELLQSLTINHSKDALLMQWLDYWEIDEKSDYRDGVDYTYGTLVIRDGYSDPTNGSDYAFIDLYNDATQEYCKGTATSYVEVCGYVENCPIYYIHVLSDTIPTGIHYNDDGTMEEFFESEGYLIYDRNI